VRAPSPTEAIHAIVHCVLPRTSVDLALRSTALLGEGPRWDASAARLIWVDIEGGALHLFDPASGDDRAIELGERVCAAAPIAGGEVLIALAGRIVVLDLSDDSVETLAELPHGAGIRLNDGVCDPAGRFWVGSMALDERPGAGALYRYAGGLLDRVFDGVTLSNGIGWAPGGRRMFYIDSPTYRVDQLDFDVGSGQVSRRRPFVSIDPADGIPDGLAVDDDGGVWVALWGGAAVRRYAPDGSLDRVVDVPADKVTACCFGGHDGRSLYVTTASVGLTAEQARRQPLAGSVFVTDAGVSGPPASPFAR
jgi:sugar lactone lactonase YvrE